MIATSIKNYSNFNLYVGLNYHTVNLMTIYPRFSLFPFPNKTKLMKTMIYSLIYSHSLKRTTKVFCANRLTRFFQT